MKLKDIAIPSNVTALVARLAALTGMRKNPISLVARMDGRFADVGFT